MRIEGAAASHRALIAANEIASHGQIAFIVFGPKPTGNLSFSIRLASLTSNGSHTPAPPARNLSHRLLFSPRCAQSASGLAHSQTLHAIRESPANAPASWPGTPPLFHIGRTTTRCRPTGAAARHKVALRYRIPTGFHHSTGLGVFFG